MKQTNTQTEYIASLEEQLARFKANTTIVNYYKGIKKQIDDISRLLQEITISAETLQSKDDKFFDRYFRFMEKSDVIADNLFKLESKINPINNSVRIRDDAVAEKHIFEKK